MSYAVKRQGRTYWDETRAPDPEPPPGHERPRGTLSRMPYLSAPERFLLKRYNDPKRTYKVHIAVYGAHKEGLALRVMGEGWGHVGWICGQVTFEPPDWLRYREDGWEKAHPEDVVDWVPRHGLTALNRYWPLFVRPHWSIYEQLASIKEHGETDELTFLTNVI